MEIVERRQRLVALFPVVADLLEDGVDSGYWTAVKTASSDPEDQSRLVGLLSSLVTGAADDNLRSLKLRGGELMQLAGEVCVFWMDGKKLETMDLASLDCHVRSPSGFIYPAQLELREDFCSVSCRFRPLECGQHTAFLLFRRNNHLQSSLPILVSRNYSQPQPRPAVQLDIEIDDSTGQLQKRKPWGIACNANTEQVGMCDREKHEVLVFGPDGEKQFRFGSLGSGAGEFNRPTALAWDCAGDRFLVADKDNHRIQIFSSAGHFISSFGSRGRLPGQFNFPWGVAISKDGQLIVVADSRNARIQFFDANGRFLRLHRGQFKFPRGVAFDQTGRSVLVSDFNLHCIFKVDVTVGTSHLLVDGSLLRRPSGLDVDVCGNVVVCDSRNNCLKIFSPTGQLLHCIRSIGNVSLDLPLDVVVMPANYLAVLDHNGRLRIF